MLIWGLTETLAQSNNEISGVIIDLDGNPISRANIRHGGGVIGAFNGAFKLELSQSPDTLKITSVGYLPIERIVNGGDSLRIRMTPSVEVLEEVVVYTGYQALSPNEINGSVAVIDEEAIRSRAGLNVLDRIVGHSSGVLESIGKVGNSTGITIRGLGTINGPLEPLIVLDGFIYEGHIENINPNDVENISILKDAAAASIWGARAGNGVIVITTKKGMKEQAIQVDFNINQSLTAIPELGGVAWMGAAASVEVDRYLFENGYFNTQIKNTPYRALTPAVEILLAAQEGHIDSLRMEEMLSDLALQDKRQAYREFYKNHHLQQYNFSVRGGGNRYVYGISSNFDRTNDHLHSISDRFNIRLSNQFWLSKNVTLSAEGQYSRNNTQSGRSGYDSRSVAGRKPDYLSFRDGFGNPIGLDQVYRSIYTDSIGAGMLMDWKLYPTEDYQYHRTQQHREEVIGSVSLKYQATDYLTFSSSYQQQLQRSSRNTLADENSYAARDFINKYSQIDLSRGSVQYIVPVGGIKNSSSSSVSSFTWRNQADINKLFGAHRIAAIAGFEIRQSGIEEQQDPTQYGYYEDPLTFAQVDVLNPHREFITGSMTRIGSGSYLKKLQYRFISVYGNASYSYRGKYTLSGSVRRDGSNIFGVETNDRWKPLWSSGLGWRVSEEDFYESRLFPSLRLTATYGYSGNVDMSRTALPIVFYSTHDITQLRYTRVLTINNPELRWEQLSQFNIRLDAAIRQDRIRFSLGYFIKKGSDLYGEAPYDYTGWGVTNTLVRNVAKMKGYGLELEIHSRNVSSPQFLWDTDFYGNWNDNRTLDYYHTGNQSPLSLLVSGGSIITPVVGQPLYGIAAYRWAGLDEEGDPLGYIGGEFSKDYRGISTDGVETGNNLVFIGSSSPTYFGSLVNTFQWKQISLSVNLNFRLGYYFRKSAIQYSQLVQFGRGHSEYLDRWKEPGDEYHTTVPAFGYPLNSDRDAFYQFAELNVLRADHVRLDYLNLGYKVSTVQWKRPLRKIEIRLGMQPKGIIWRANKEGLDPDFPESGPRPMQWTLGLSLTI